MVDVSFSGARRISDCMSSSCVDDVTRRMDDCNEQFGSSSRSLFHKTGNSPDFFNVEGSPMVRYRVRLHLTVLQYLYET